MVAAVMCIGMIAGCSKTLQVDQSEADPAKEETLQEADDYEYAEDNDELYEEEYENEEDADNKDNIGGGSKLCISGKDVNGNSVNTADIFAKNKITIVNLWASWCGPCAGEIPELDKMNGELKEKGCEVIGFLTDGEDPYALEDAKDILEDSGATYTNVICSESLTYKIGLEAFPTTCSFPVRT